MASAHLLLDHPTGPVRVGEVGARPLTIGRSPSGDLVFPDDRVSWQHASLWFEGGVLWVKDLGSRNGTLVNGERLAGPRVVTDGDRVGIGPAVVLSVRYSAVAPLLIAQTLVIEDLSTKVRYPMRGERFTIGADAPSTGSGAVILVTGPDDLWLGIDGEDRLIKLDEAFDVDGRPWAVRQGSLDRSPTFEATPTAPLYDLDAILGGESGAEAYVTDASTGKVRRLEGENRAVLLYILGKKALADADLAVPLSERGWVNDEDVATGIWGRSQASRDVNGLHVLLHRIRKELAEAGFDPWFIEKRRKCVRARFSKVVLR